MIQAELSGRITMVDPGIETSVQIEDRFHFAYSFSSDAADFLPNDHTIGTFLYSEFALSIGPNFVQSSGDKNSITVWAFEPISEHYYVRAYLTKPFVGMTEPAAIIGLSRWPVDNWLLSGDAIPTDLELADFDYPVFTLEDLAQTGPQITGLIDSMNFSVVPEPTMCMPLALGLLLVIRRRNSYSTQAGAVGERHK